ncbi:class I adenylate-forming enzyme family protein [Mumia zhuanghuii]|uniref:Long-chain fatty acid--CoA ligase n=1 Tax=Mumia zhuanghuii TaxID=2585211 RepID=A0A5C4MK64_9ACTN|nr:AMP-binding protein [Mumia zhuanghuii]TNC41008.1 long-chain fatty acid--CoA ligase [Mumia zhuanghuii]TNC49248.1 long-chain fatty acid--CoA ligase [Mumia zhuanghuii]
MTVNVAELVSRQASLDPHGTALVEAYGTERALTWAALDDQVSRVAAWLSGQGLVAGQRVALVLTNRLELPVTYFAALRLGLVVVPVNPRAPQDEVTALCATTGVRLVVCDPDWAATFAGAGLPTVVAGDDDPQAPVRPFSHLLQVSPGPRGLPPAPADPETTALLMPTSGTSTDQRIVILSHRALLANIEQVAAVEPAPVSADDVVVVMLPLFHVFALNAVLGQAVRQGACTVLVDRFDRDETLRVIARHGVTVVPLAPPVVAAWCGRPGVQTALAGVRVLLSGAAPIDADLVEEFGVSSGHPLEQGYGLTEAGPVVTTTLGRSGDKPASVGAPLAGIELRLVDKDGTEAEPGDPGEIWLRGPNLLSGFWPDASGGPDDDGWFATGDVGILDADGDLTLVDRLRDLVIVSGFNVYPREVEEVLADGPGVAEVAVVGVEDRETGEAVRAYVVASRPGADPDTLAAALREHARGRLARFKVPREIVVVDSLPHTTTGEISKSRLRAAQARRGVLGLQ